MKHTKRFLVAIALLLATLLISGLALAEEAKTDPTITLDKTAYEVELNYYPWALLELNDDFVVTKTDPDGKIKDYTLSSSDTSVAKASGYFLIAEAPGKTTLTVQALDENGAPLTTAVAKAEVTFKKVEATKIVYNTKWDEKLLNLKVGKSVELAEYNDDYSGYSVTVLPENATYSYVGSLVWTTENTDIIRLSKSGYLTALKAGDATVKVATKDGKASTTFDVKVVNDPVTSITFTPDSFTLKYWQHKDYFFEYAEVEPADLNTYKESILNAASWASSNQDVATIEYEDGGTYIAPKNAGEATITVTYKNVDGTYVSGSFKVVVETNLIESLAFDKEEYKEQWKNGATIDLYERLAVTPYDAYRNIDGEADILWESSDTTIATVDDDGDVVFVKPGTVTITAKCAHDEKITATAKVTAEKIAVTGIKLSRTSIEYVYNTATYSDALQVVVEPKYAYVDGYNFSISSSNTDIVKVSGFYEEEDGKYRIDVSTYGKAGTATITAKLTDGEKTFEATGTITVANKARKLKIVSDNGQTLYLKKNESANKQAGHLRAIDTGDYRSEELDVTVTWKSSKTSVATIDRNGYITPKKEGKTTITATTKDGMKTTAKITITVKKELIKKLSGSKKITMRVGGVDNAYEYITVTPAASNLYYSKLQFSSSNKDIVSVNSNGTLTANAVGTAKITVKAKDGSGKTFTFKVKVIEERKAK